MEIVILLVPLAFLFLAVAIGVFVWALRRGQFDDMDSPGWRIIFDDREARRPDSRSNGEDTTAQRPSATDSPPDRQRHRTANGEHDHGAD